MLQMDFITVLVTLDFIMFSLILVYVRKLWKGVKQQLAAIAEDPDNMAAIGRGIAQGMRHSADGTAGKDKQVSRAQERTLMTTILKDWMGNNAPMVRMLMDQFPETWRLVQQQPELGFMIMTKLGPAMEGKIGKMADQAVAGLQKVVK